MGVQKEIRTIVESARSMLYARDLPLDLWAEAVNCAVYILNRTSSSQTPGKTPYELWNGTKPELGHLKVFGSIGYVHVPDQLRTKLEKKSEKMLLIGYDNTNYRMYDMNKKTIKISRNVIFDEHQVPETYDEALQSPQKYEWSQAIKEELSAHKENNTWNAVPRAGQRTLTTKWVFTIKKGENNEAHYKARLCARGFTQIKDVDYQEIFSPTTSQKQKTIALSTTEAEFVASCETAKEILWLQQLLLELGESCECVTMSIFFGFDSPPSLLTREPDVEGFFFSSFEKFVNFRNARSKRKNQRMTSVLLGSPRCAQLSER
ncbi:Retrovirus-related Pol polyprotein from transposon TNT 1-94 [Eumeta japonica]|uniref:Retrovirus-related Pol polyprotein from transposon TNT 1-94 n=1 Tax=Eumeta variegata TaxID=151549 RepID=A0A4C1UZ28_EUMVA|nr:Retrovirus-related Pol polyprotein from transposon TNT 1-94 [Eumeta japonica]